MNNYRLKTVVVHKPATICRLVAERLKVKVKTNTSYFSDQATSQTYCLKAGDLPIPKRDIKMEI